MVPQDSPSTPSGKDSRSSSRTVTPQEGQRQCSSNAWSHPLFPANFEGMVPIDMDEIPGLGMQVKFERTTQQNQQPSAHSTARPRHDARPAAPPTSKTPQILSQGTEQVLNSFGKGHWGPATHESFSEAESQLQSSNGKDDSTMPITKFFDAILPCVSPIMNSTRPDERKELDCIVEVRKWARENPGSVPRGNLSKAKDALEQHEYEWLKAARREIRNARNSVASPSSVSASNAPTPAPHNSDPRRPSQASPSASRAGNSTSRQSDGNSQPSTPSRPLADAQQHAPGHHEHQQSGPFSQLNPAMFYGSQYGPYQQQGFQHMFSPPAAADMSYFSNPYLNVGNSPQHAQPNYYLPSPFAQVPPPQYHYHAPPQYQQPAPANVPRPRNLPTAVWTFLNAVNPMVAPIRNQRDREEMVTQWAYGHMVQVPLFSSHTLDLSDDEQKLLWAAQRVLPEESRRQLYSGQ